MTVPLPARARIVVIGGGVIGTSVAYHLTKLGWTDVVLARAGPALLRHDLARGRPRRPAPRDARAAPGSCSTPPRCTRELEDETGLAHRLQALRRRHRGPHRRTG